MGSLYEQGLPQPGGYRDITVSTLNAGAQGARLVDVRETPELTGVLGKIAGVEHAPLRTVLEAAAAWPRDADIIMICRSGGRSARAAAELTEAGFTRVMNLAGGMLAWNEARLPVVLPEQERTLSPSEVLEQLRVWLAALNLPVPGPHSTPPSRDSLVLALELMQATATLVAREQAALERLLREFRDILAVTRDEGGKP